MKEVIHTKSSTYVFDLKDTEKVNNITDPGSKFTSPLNNRKLFGARNKHRKDPENKLVASCVITVRSFDCSTLLQLESVNKWFTVPL